MKYREAAYQRLYLGFVDAKFAKESGEASLGETLHLVGEDIRAFAHLAQKVVDALDAWIGGVALPTRERDEPDEYEDGMFDAASAAARELGFGELAYRVGIWLSDHYDSGLDAPIDGGAMAPDFEGVSTQDLIYVIT